jgi:hypothetical protein
VFEEASTFRGRLKTHARHVMYTKYDLFLNGGHGQAEAAEYMLRHVQELLSDSSFMHYGVDEQVRYHSNMSFVLAFTAIKGKGEQLQPPCR